MSSLSVTCYGLVETAFDLMHARLGFVGPPLIPLNSILAILPLSKVLLAAARESIPLKY